MKHICERLIEAAQYLESHGMSLEQLRSIHHSKLRLETFHSTYRYFGTNKELKLRNAAYAERLLYIAENHRRGDGSISKLALQANQRWPL